MNTCMWLLALSLFFSCFVLAAVIVSGQRRNDA